MAEEELRRPVPERRARPDEPRERDQVDQTAAGRRDQPRQAAADVQVASDAPPAFRDRRKHAIECRAARLQRRRAVVQVVPNDEAAAGPQPARDPLDHGRRIRQEAEEPTHEGAVQRGGLQPQLLGPLHARRELLETAPGRFTDQGGDEARRLVDGKHPPTVADPFRQFESGESRSAAEVEQARPWPEPGAVPQVARRLRPQAVLRLEGAASPRDRCRADTDLWVRALSQRLVAPKGESRPVTLHSGAGRATFARDVQHADLAIGAARAGRLAARGKTPRRTETGQAPG